MQKKVRKLVIPAAGWGTRFLPFTKAVHKELLPILNKPTIQLLVDEANQSGIEEIIFILAERKQNIYDFFSPNDKLRELLFNAGKKDLYNEIKKTTQTCKISTINQQEQLGLGHAIWLAKEKIGNEPFAVILGDDLIYSKKPAIKQLIEYYDKVQSTVFGVQTISKNNIHQYGVVDPKTNAEGIAFEIKGAIEKPSIDKAPSDKAILGRYVFTPTFLDYININKTGAGNEVNLLDALDEFLKHEKIYAYEFSGIRYDLGSVTGFVKATIDYALRDPKIKDEIYQFISEKKK